MRSILNKNARVRFRAFCVHFTCLIRFDPILSANLPIPHANNSLQYHSFSPVPYVSTFSDNVVSSGSSSRILKVLLISIRKKGLSPLCILVFSKLLTYPFIHFPHLSQSTLQQALPSESKLTPYMLPSRIVYLPQISFLMHSPLY